MSDRTEKKRSKRTFTYTMHVTIELFENGRSIRRLSVETPKLIDRRALKLWQSAETVALEVAKS